MRTNAYRDEEEYYDEYDTSGNTVWRRRDEDASARPPDDRDYWRRRFLILSAGVVALGACAFLFPGAHRAPARTSASVRASMSAAAERQSLPPAAYGSAWLRPTPTESPRPAPSPSASPAAAKPATGAALAKPGVRRSPAASAPAGPAGVAPCAPASVVLSLATSRTAYARSQMPVFSVYAVSTAAAPCTLPYGDGAVRVVVTSRGRVVWDSATCHPPAARPVRFTLGVPQVVAMTWNPTAGRPAGCAGSPPAGPSGPLDAVAVSHGQSSPVRTFTWNR